MFRNSVIMALLMSLALVLSGCVVQKSAYQRKYDEADRLGMEVASLQQQNKALAEENEGLRQQVQELSADRQEPVETVRPTSTAAPAGKEAPKAAEEKITESPQEKAAVTPQAETAKPVPEKKDMGLKSIRLKVLSGNGKMSSARKMAGRLTRLGYKVEVVGMATTPDYARDTVYYKPDFEMQAVEMAKKLGGKAITKPMSWSSVFDVIAVAGK